MFSFPTIYGEIIQEYLHECQNKFADYFHIYPLKSCRLRLEAEHHDYSDKYSPIGDKSGLFLVVRMHSYIIVATKTVQETVYFMTGYRIQDSIREWEWEGVSYRCRI